MFGSFIQSRRAIQAGEEILPGIPIVALLNATDFEQKGTIDAMRFGIYDGTGHVFFRKSFQFSIEKAHEKLQYEVLAVSMSSFCPEGWTLYTYSEKDAVGTPADVLRRAQHRLHEQGYGYAGITGDDFVYECLTTRTLWSYLEAHPEVGSHIWTPLNYTLTDILREIGVQKTFQFPDIFKLRHHGLRMEHDTVIHFARRADDMENRLRIDSYADFLKTTPDAPDGGEVKGGGRSITSRLIARNAAIGILLHRHLWGKYNLFTNNCEHFSTYCRSGIRCSEQVAAAQKKALSAFVTQVLPWLIPGGQSVKAARLIQQILTPLLHLYVLRDTQNAPQLQISNS